MVLSRKEMLKISAAVSVNNTHIIHTTKSFVELHNILASERKDKSINGYFEIQICVAEMLEQENISILHSDILNYFGIDVLYHDRYYVKIENALFCLRNRKIIDGWTCFKEKVKNDYLYLINIKKHATIKNTLEMDSAEETHLEDLKKYSFSKLNSLNTFNGKEGKKTLTVKVRETTKKFLHNITRRHIHINQELLKFIDEVYLSGHVDVSIYNKFYNKGDCTFSKQIPLNTYSVYLDLCKRLDLRKSRMNDLFFSWLLQRHKDKRDMRY